ncbi:MAG TPA: solute carrier family 23 protein [bacterium]|nr:solute carrier family 23 protein [bacterium]
MAERAPYAFLPPDRPPVGAMVSLGFQHVLTMFPATVLVALLTGFDPGVTLFASGLATVLALLLSGMRIPMYYGSSFSYIAAIRGVTVPVGASAPNPALVPLAQVGIIGTAIVNVIAGFIVRAVGKARLDKVLPPVVTGSVAVVIGIALGKAALDLATGTCCNPAAVSEWWTVAIITLLVTIIFSVYLRGRGLIGMLPVLLGAVVGYVVAWIFGLVNFAPVGEAAWLRVPDFSFPAFGDPKAWATIFAIAPIAIATIPESTAHLYQISLYIDRVATELRREKLEVKKLVGLNLILDGVGDGVNGLLGGCAGTNYGENNSLMVITRNYSGPVLVAAGVIAMLLGFVGKLAALVQTLPPAVTGGLAIYLFGVIGLQGVALMMAEGVDFFDPRQLAIGAAILVIGIGGAAFPGGNIPIWGWQLPSIATSAMAGILINLIFLLFPPERYVPAAMGTMGTGR